MPVEMILDKFYPIPEHPRYEINEGGVIRNASNKKIKNQYKNDAGYLMVSFSYKNKSKPYRVHRLLASVFLPNPNNLAQINHKDGNKLNNSLNNLEWVTCEQNVIHAFNTGLINNTGINNGMNKLMPEQVSEIKRLLSSGMSQYKIAKVIGGISRSTVLKINLGQMWKKETAMPLFDNV